eukprot:jgi/Botrbrau1/732/Bobra.160_2s0055.1
MGRREIPGTSLLVRNLSKNARIEDLRYAAEKYGRVRDVYIPRDYYTGEPRGIGFIEYSDPRDAEDAKFGLDRRMIEGREISVVFALQGRKRPEEYRAAAGGSGGRRRGEPPRPQPLTPQTHGVATAPQRSYTPSRSPSRSRSRTPHSASPARSPAPKEVVTKQEPHRVPR